MIVSLSQIKSQHDLKLKSNNEIRDARNVDDLTNTPPIRVVIKRKQDGGTTTKRIYAGE